MYALPHKVQQRHACSDDDDDAVEEFWDARCVGAWTLQYHIVVGTWWFDNDTTTRSL